MMKKFSLLLIGFVWVIQLFAYTPQDIKAQYEELFFARYDSPYVLIETRTLPDTHHLSGLINKNDLFLGYLTSNYIGFDPFQALRQYGEDSVQLHKHLIKKLRGDDLFNRWFLNLVNNYLKSQGDSLEQFQAAPPLSVIRKELREIGSKFFYAWKMNDEGGVMYKVCSGVDWHGFFPERENIQSRFLEALAYQTIFLYMPGVSDQHKTGKYWNQFLNHRKKLEKELKDVPKEQRVAKAREKMFAYMDDNESLEKLLVKEFKKRNYLFHAELK